MLNVGSLLSSILMGAVRDIQAGYDATKQKKKNEKELAKEAEERLKQIALEQKRIEEELAYQRARKSRLLKEDIATLRSKLASTGILSSDASASILLSQRQKQGEEDIAAELKSYEWNLDDLASEAFVLKPLTQKFIKSVAIRKKQKDDEESTTKLI